MKKYGLRKIILPVLVILFICSMAYNLKDYLPTTNFGSGRTFSPSLPLIDGVTATSTSSTLPAAIMAKDFNNVVFAVETTGNANATIKFTATTLDSPHDPTTTSTITNQWAPIQVIDLSDGTSYDGTTGIVISGTDVHKMFEANISSLSWIRPMVSSYTTGTIYVYGIASTNQ